MLTFSVDDEHLPALTRALDHASSDLAKNPNFRGLLGLECNSGRHEIVIITLWEGEGLEDSAADSEASRRLIAEAVDLGVRSRNYAVLSFDAGDTQIPRLLAHPTTPTASL